MTRKIFMENVVKQMNEQLQAYIEQLETPDILKKQWIIRYKQEENGYVRY